MKEVPQIALGGQQNKKPNATTQKQVAGQSAAYTRLLRHFEGSAIDYIRRPTRKEATCNDTKTGQSVA